MFWLLSYILAQHWCSSSQQPPVVGTGDSEIFLRFCFICFLFQYSNRITPLTSLTRDNRPLRQYRGSLLRMCSEMHYGNVRLQTNATTWFSGPVASHNELTMFQFCNLFTHSWNYFMGCYILLWTPDASRPNCIMWLWCSWNQIPCLGKGFDCISTFPEFIAVGHVLAIDEVVYAVAPLFTTHG